MGDKRTLIDTDGHVMETISDLRPYLDPAYQRRDEYERSAIGGAIPSPYGWPLPPAASRARHVAASGHVFSSDYYGIGAEGWVAFMDDVGIETTVLFPSMGGLMLGLVKDRDWACAFAQAYNNWLSESFLKKSPRLRGAAILPLQDVSEAVRELRRAVTELGMVGGMLNAGLDHLLGNEVYWPLYEDAQRLDCPVVSHGGPGRNPGFNVDYMGFGSFVEMHTLHQPLSNLLQLNSLVFRGVFDKFPRLRVFIAEVGCEWVPYWMDRADEEWEYAALSAQKPATSKPSDVIKSGRVFFQAADYEHGLRHAAERLGTGCLVFSSDYPHELGRKSPDGIKNMLADYGRSLESGGKPDGLKEKVFQENAKLLYRLH